MGSAGWDVVVDVVMGLACARALEDDADRIATTARRYLSMGPCNGTCPQSSKPIEDLLGLSLAVSAFELCQRPGRGGQWDLADMAW